MPPGSPAAFPLSVTRHCADVPACQHPPPHPGARSMSPAHTRSLAAFAQSHSCSPTYSRVGPRSPRESLLPPPRRSPMAVSEDASPSAGEHLIENDPMITRLGRYMALLGP